MSTTGERVTHAVLAGWVATTGCAPAQKPAAPGPPEHESFEDPHSRARPGQVRVRHVGLRWLVSFDDRALDGVATMLIDRAHPDRPLVLDTRGLEIARVDVGRTMVGQTMETTELPSTPRLVTLGDDASWRTAVWTLGPEDPVLGQALVVELPSDVNVVRVTYRTGPGASGLQWLDPEQTADRSAPFLYSQSQAIHARSWWPCQDTPSVRTTFDAEVTVADPMRAVMAAREDQPPEKNDGTHTFRFVMEQPIPSYLVALAAGRLELRELGGRTGVWAEPSVVERAAYEFADLEQMLIAAERLYGRYRWGRYDVLVLPPAFPFGGMENPRLTFATPTILAGDRSLVALVAHELAHSWSGNLATNATWADIWLNEGFTVYAERRILEELYGGERAEIEAVVGLGDLRRDFADLAAADQHLVLELRDRDPDDGMTAVPYEKGALLLRALELAYGRSTFDAFLRRWYEAHAFSSVTTDDFLAFLATELVANHEVLAGQRKPNLEQWLRHPGLPENAPLPSSPALVAVEDAVARFASGEASAKRLATDDWTAHHWVHFLRGLPGNLSTDRVAELDEAFALTRATNYEVLAEWLAVAARHGYIAARPRLEQFLLRVGRRKYLTPLYKQLAKTDDARRWAREVYARARPGYHAITRRTLDDVLDWAD